MSTKALKNYYVVLGVHRGENAKGIRAAYKDLAKQFHPDRIGEQGNKTFQEISEAYQTLQTPKSADCTTIRSTSKRTQEVRWVQRRAQHVIGASLLWAGKQFHRHSVSATHSLGIN